MGLIVACIFILIGILLITLMRRLINIESIRKIKLIIAIYAILLLVATIYVGVFKPDVVPMTKQEKNTIVKENTDFLERAENGQLKGKEEPFFVKTFTTDVPNNKLFITFNTVSDIGQIIIYMNKVNTEKRVVEGTVYHTNAYYLSLQLNESQPFVKVDGKTPSTITIHGAREIDKRFRVATDTMPLFPFNPPYFKGYNKSYSLILPGYTIIDLKVPRGVKVKDFNKLIVQK